MPPEAYTPVTISDSLATTLTRIMADHECSSDAAAIEYVVDTTLLQEEKITIQELSHLLAERAEEIDESRLQ